jgi:hypothetical protein
MTRLRTLLSLLHHRSRTTNEIPQEPLYRPLKAGRIRLLTILSIDPTIDCLLEISTLAKASAGKRPFNALSYFWGSEPFSETVSCNGIPLNITPSLFDTLREIYLYHEGNPENRRPIWIDAICLNQQDQRELEVQVPIMYEIYSKACIVLVYLGSSKDESDFAMTSIENLRDRLKAIPDQDILYDMLPELGIEARGHRIWTAIEDLLARPWFSRVWTFQEATLAKEIIFGCGSKWLAGDILYELEIELDKKALVGMVERRARREAYENCSRTGRQLLTDLERSRKEYQKYKNISIRSLLSITRGRNCKEPVDHLWGMLGLMQPKIRNLVRSSGWIDYSVTGRTQFWRSYITFAKWVVENGKGLELLSTTRSFFKPQELPSWCPNWVSAEMTKSLSVTYNCGYDNEESRRSEITADVDRDRIRVPGFRIDTIDQVVKQRSDLDSLLNILAWESHCLELSRRVYNSDNVPEAHRRTLIGDLLYRDKENYLLPCEQDPEYNYNLWKASLEKMSAEALGERELNQSVVEYQAWIEYYESFSIICEGRAFFSTSKGRIGLGPSDVAKGDVVCVFYSGDPLYVIRFKDRDGEGEEAELVGEAYVHGLMRKGQAFNSPDREADEIFVLV